MKEIHPVKKQEVERVFEEFSRQAEGEIRLARRIGEGVDLKGFFTANEAVEYGLVDEIGRINQVVPQQFTGYELKRLEEGRFEKIRNDLRKMNVW